MNTDLQNPLVRTYSFVESCSKLQGIFDLTRTFTILDSLAMFRFNPCPRAKSLSRCGFFAVLVIPNDSASRPWPLHPRAGKEGHFDLNRLRSLTARASWSSSFSLSHSKGSLIKNHEQGLVDFVPDPGISPPEMTLIISMKWSFPNGGSSWHIRPRRNQRRGSWPFPPSPRPSVKASPGTMMDASAGVLSSPISLQSPAPELEPYLIGKGPTSNPFSAQASAERMLLLLLRQPRPPSCL